MIQVERLHNTGTCYGGHVVTENSAFAAEFPASQVAMYDEHGTGMILSRDEAIQLICALQTALRDG